MSILLLQSDAEKLIAMPKRSVDGNPHVFPAPGEKMRISLTSVDRTEDFQLDVRRSRIDLAQITYQARARQVVVLVRLDVDGPPHRNPDGEIIPCPHLHIYQEGYGDKWAHPIPEDRFSNVANPYQTLTDFMVHCNVVELPIIQGGLF